MTERSRLNRAEDDIPAPKIDTTRPSPARLYDYYLGGKDNYEADRRAAEEIFAIVPEGASIARENRAFLRRAVRYLTAEVGILQFIDLGSGLPTADNVHQVAQRECSDARVVYVDNDPVVSVRGQALLATDEKTTVIQADFRRPRQILEHPELLARIDLTAPVAVICAAVLHFASDADDPWAIIRMYGDAVAPGSHLAISTITAEGQTPEAVATITEKYSTSTAPAALRMREEIEAFFGGWEMVPPGVTHAPCWRPDIDAPTGTTWMLAGVARKP